MWAAILLLVVIFFLFSTFKSYLEKYSVPSDLKITGREEPRFNIYHRVYFCVRFQKNFGKKEIYTFASFKSEMQIPEEKIREMLTLTPLDPFFKSEATKEGEILTVDYEFPESEFKDIGNNRGDYKFKVHYLVISQEDFANLLNGIADFNFKVKISDFLIRMKDRFDW
jgi:hypothetical protein